MKELPPDKKVHIELNLRELTVIFNVLASHEFRLADALIVMPVAQQLELIIKQNMPADMDEHKTDEGITITNTIPESPEEVK